MTAGAAAQAAEAQSMQPMMRSVLNWYGWACVPLAVESYGALGAKKPSTVSHLASQLAVHICTSSSKSKTTFDLYSRLNLALVRSTVVSV